MKPWRMLTLAVALAATAQGGAAGAAPAAGAVIPLPLKLQAAEGAYALTAETAIRVQAPGLEAIGRYLAACVQSATGLRLAAGPAEPAAGGIALKLDPARRDLGDEGYTLHGTPLGVTIVAPKPAGVFYGVQTLRQLLPVTVAPPPAGAGGAWPVPCVLIEDRPRFAWRGYLLDPARHFRTKDELKRYIDLLAFHKLNRFQLHLTDDQGWRVEIKRYPKLTGVGARLKNVSGGTGDGWFYTQEDVRELVAYAASRYVTIVPEIEMPGHSGAATTAYPELGCGGRPSSELCVSQEGTFEYARNVLDEVMELFPSACIHVGADEVAPGRWRACPTCKPLMEKLAATALPADVTPCRVNVTSGAGRPFNEDVARLQGEFVRRIDRHLAARGRRMVGWDEILDGGLQADSRALVMAWRSPAAITGAAGQKRDVIVSLYPDYYLDNGIPLQRTYDCEPLPADLPADQAESVAGVQGNMWGEQTPTIQRVDVQSFPRLCAVAEIGWTAREARDFGDFSERLAALLPRFDLLGVGYRKPDAGQGKPVVAANGWLVSASSSLAGHGPELAADGKLELDASWQADPYPQWLKLDLTKPATLSGIRVWPYWDGKRYYQYSVHVSTDGQTWDKVGDKLATTTPATEAGDTFAFPPRAVRYIRVNVTRNSANSGVIIVEVRGVQE